LKDNLPKSPTRVIHPDAGVVRQSGKGRLSVIRGPDRGESFVVGSTAMLAGAGVECGMRLTDPTVSRRHIEVVLGDEGLVVRDLGSTNGSYVRGARIREVVLEYGSEVQIGHTVLKYVPDEESVELVPSQTDRLGQLIGSEPRMRQLFSLLEDVSATEATVLLEGETGSGKELFAEEIHRHSPRRKHPMVVFDCASVPRELIESALFGHKKGAFTGAVTDRRGAFEEANGGTLFLDEIGELSIDLQPALLRVLDKRIVRPVGSDVSQKVDVRVVAATNRDLRQEVAARRFREDLYYRLAVVRVAVPPLRDRPVDVPLLIRHYVEQFAPGRSASISEKDMERLQRYDWPGNVRELRNVVERVVALSRGGALDLSSALPELSTPMPASEISLSLHLPWKDAKARVVDLFEKEYLKGLLDKYNGNLSAAARAAELDRKHLRELLRRHGLRDPGDG